MALQTQGDDKNENRSEVFLLWPVCRTKNFSCSIRGFRNTVVTSRWNAEQRMKSKSDWDSDNL